MFFPPKVCKYFLEAIDKGLYGWFWTCPNGGDKCIYRHALPPGFVLKKKEQKQDKDEISLEELIEEERAKLGTNLTKITLETFTTWKKRKVSDPQELKPLLIEIQLKEWPNSIMDKILKKVEIVKFITTALKSILKLVKLQS